jgi:hypothetical protein
MLLIRQLWQVLLTVGLLVRQVIFVLILMLQLQPPKLQRVHVLDLQSQVIFRFQLVQWLFFALLMLQRLPLPFLFELILRLQRLLQLVFVPQQFLLFLQQ